MSYDVFICLRASLLTPSVPQKDAGTHSKRPLFGEDGRRGAGGGRGGGRQDENMCCGEIG